MTNKFREECRNLGHDLKELGPSLWRCNKCGYVWPPTLGLGKKPTIRCPFCDVRLKFNLRGKTGAIWVPADLVRDSQFPLKPGKVKITIQGKKIIVEQA